MQSRRPAVIFHSSDEHKSGLSWTREEILLHGWNSGKLTHQCSFWNYRLQMYNHKTYRLISFTQRPTPTVTRDPQKRETRAWLNRWVHPFRGVFVEARKPASCTRGPAGMGQPRTEDAWGRRTTLLSLPPVSLSHVGGTTGGLFKTARLHTQALGPACWAGAASL